MILPMKNPSNQSSRRNSLRLTFTLKRGKIQRETVSKIWRKGRQTFFYYQSITLFSSAAGTRGTGCTTPVTDAHHPLLPRSRIELRRRSQDGRVHGQFLVGAAAELVLEFDLHLHGRLVPKRPVAQAVAQAEHEGPRPGLEVELLHLKLAQRLVCGQRLDEAALCAHHVRVVAAPGIVALAHGARVAYRRREHVVDSAGGDPVRTLLGSIV